MFGLLLSFLCGAVLSAIITVKVLRLFFRSSGFAVRVLLAWSGFSLPSLEAPRRPVPAAR